MGSGGLTCMRENLKFHAVFFSYQALAMFLLLPMDTLNLLES